MLNAVVELAPLGSRFTDALVYAVEAHEGHVRKGSGTPYVGHVLAVCALVLEEGGTEDAAIAALLHDTVEDAGGHERLDDIRARFGDHVAQIVAECSDSFETPKPPWRERKDAYLAHLDEASPDALLVSLADKTHNARAILRDYGELGETLWGRFNAGPDEVLWYYRALADAFQRLLPGARATELARILEELEAARAARMR